jgi:hypothetical protein
MSLARLLCCVSLTGLTACGGSGSGPAGAGQKDQKYAILLEREYQPGQEYRVRIQDNTTETAVLSSQGKVVSDTKKLRGLSFSGTRKVLSAGKDQPSEYVIEELSQNKEGQSQVLLPPGTRLQASPVGGKWQYTVDGKPLGEELDDALGTLLGDRTGGPGDDAIFGTKAPRAVGERWSVDMSKLPDDEISFDPKAATGSTRVVALRSVEGVECLEIEAEMAIPQLDLKGLPEGAKLLGASMSGRFLGLFPTDTKLPSLSQGMATDMTFKMEVMSPQGPVQVDAKSQTDRTVNRE